MLYLTIGLISLWFASELFVKSSSKLAQELKIKQYIIGILITSFGTSLPELILSIYAALTEHTDIVIGNIVGSNIANIAIGLGLLSLIANKKQINLNLSYIKIDQHYLLLSTIVLLIACYLTIFNKPMAILSLVIMALFVRQQLIYGYNSKNEQNTQKNKINYKIISLEFFFILIAAGLIYLGSKWTILGAVQIARSFDISEFIIGLITIALGTSLPEIAVVLAACRKGKASLALGNIIGSNIYNVFFILSITSLIKSIIIDLNIFSFIMIYLSILTILSGLALKFLTNKISGLLLLLSYPVFVYFSVYT